MSRVSRRTMLAGAGISVAINSALATPSIMAMSAQAGGDDAPLFDLCRRWREARQVVECLGGEYERLGSLLPDLKWTPEELTAHRIDGAKDKPLYISPVDLERSNRADDPRKPKRETSETDDGTTCVVTHVYRSQNPSEDEISAWRSRCAARQELYHAKNLAYHAAFQKHGLDAADERINAAAIETDRLWDEVKDYRPQTIAGALEKLRVFRECDEEQFGGDPEELEWPARLFLTALSDLERLTGGGAS